MSQPHDHNPFVPPSQGTAGHQPVTGQSPWAHPEQPWQWGPPAYPAYPPQPQPPQQPPKPPQQDRARNSYAVPAMALGICGLILPFPLLGVIFGGIALNQIGKSGERGKGMAITGIVFGSLWIIGYVVGFVAAVVGDDVERDSTGDVSAGGRVSIENLRVGDCVESIDEDGQYHSVDVVPCDEPHGNEVFAKFDVRGEAWPGKAAVRADAEAGCADALNEYAPTAYADPDVELFHFYPTPLTWADGDREIICLTGYVDGPRVGSIEGK